jgi:hypothetical protein
MSRLFGLGSWGWKMWLISGGESWFMESGGWLLDSLKLQMEEFYIVLRHLNHLMIVRHWQFSSTHHEICWQI